MRLMHQVEGDRKGATGWTEASADTSEAWTCARAPAAASPQPDGPEQRDSERLHWQSMRGMGETQSRPKNSRRWQGNSGSTLAGNSGLCQLKGGPFMTMSTCDTDVLVIGGDRAAARRRRWRARKGYACW